MTFSTPPPGSFTFEPLFLLIALAMVALYVPAARRYRPAWWRMVSFGVGVAFIAVSVNSPIETLAVHYLLLAHLVQNALLADLAPPLVMIGLNGPMWEAFDRRTPGFLKVFENLGLALFLWLGAWYFVHLAPVYEYALRHPQWLNVEHLALMLAGFVFWAPVVRAQWRERSPAVLVPYLLVAFVAASALGLAFTFVPHAFYDYYRDTPRLAGISAVEDQNLGGIAMTAEQSLVFLTAIAYVLLLLADREQARAEMSE